MKISDNLRSLLTNVGILALFIALCLALISFSCEDTATKPGRSNAERTASSLVKIDDYPLYAMRFYGDYGDVRASRIGAPAETLAALAAPDPADAGVPFLCTTFAALNPAGEYLLGRNFDWIHRAALVLYTDPTDGYASVSMVDLAYLGIAEGTDPASEALKLLAAPRWPFDGMNEHGFAVGMMAVPHAEGGDDPAKPTIGSCAAIRLMLDRARTVDEAVVLLDGCNISFSGGPPVHYLVSDALGHAAVIEYIANEMVVTRADTLWQIATNFIIDGCAWSGSPSECWRYNAALGALEEGNGVLDAGGAMAILGEVSQPSTMWSVVYGGAGTVALRMGRDGARHDFTFAELRALK